MRILRYFTIMGLMAAGLVFFWARSFSPNMTAAADYEEWLATRGAENSFTLLEISGQEKVPTLKENFIAWVRYGQWSYRWGSCHYLIQGSDGSRRDLELVSANGKIVVCDPLPEK